MFPNGKSVEEINKEFGEALSRFSKASVGPKREDTVWDNIKLDPKCRLLQGHQ